MIWAQSIIENSSEVQKSELDAAELLHKLEASYNEIADSYGKDGCLLIFQTFYVLKAFPF